MHNGTQFGGEIILEIDETKLEHRKYNRGRLIIGQWIFSGVERHTNKIFVIPIISYKAKVLLPLQKYIAFGSVIHNDCWKAYEQIDKRIHQHLVKKFQIIQKISLIQTQALIFKILNNYK